MPISTKYRQKAVFLLTIAVMLVNCLTACSFSPSSAGQNTAEPLQRSTLLLDTVVTVTLYGGGDEALIEECFDLCRRYEKLFSRTDPESELYALNQAGSMEVSPELLSLLQTALDYCALSGGAFDITLGGVSELYGFSSDSPRVPEAEELAEALRHVGYEKLRIEGSTVTLTDPEAVIDLGAIAKGYIADRLAEFLLENGQESATIDLGGNILCVGSKPGGSAFRIGIQCPFQERSETIDVVSVRDRSVVTSGIYERSFESGGVLYHHILDPATGLPCQNDLLGVSIISRNSVDGDALSTVCFALGLEEGLALIDSLEDTYALFIAGDYQLHYSQGFEEALKETEGKTS